MNPVGIALVRMLDERKADTVYLLLCNPTLATARKVPKDLQNISIWTLESYGTLAGEYCRNEAFTNPL
jgi:hypothetical protein